MLEWLDREIAAAGARIADRIEWRDFERIESEKPRFVVSFAKARPLPRYSEPYAQIHYSKPEPSPSYWAQWAAQLFGPYL